MSKIPTLNTVSLADSLDSFQEGVKWLLAVANATNEVSSTNQYTIVQGYNDFAAIEGSIDKRLLNTSIDPFMTTLKTKFDALLSSRPLMVVDPTDYDGNAYVQPQYQGHPATLKDLVDAINSKSADQFTLDFTVHGNGGFNDACTWCPREDLDSSRGAFDSIITCTAYHDTAWADNNNGIHADYRCNGGCHPTWDAHVTISYQAMENIARVNVDSAGHTIDLTQTAPYVDLASTLLDLEQ